jgi:ferredoxin/flavodoxin---NADP+ reductase
MAEPNSQYFVAVIGAGPAGLFAARELADQGVRVTLFNRDIKPGGLAEYGIYPSKLRMKEGLRNQFRQILEIEGVDYFGNVLVGLNGDIQMEDLRAAGYHAALVTVGAQSTKWLGLPGEDLPGVYHAKDIVYHYNLLPPFSEHTYQIGKRVAVVGAGNVMMDIAHWLVEEKRVDEVYAVARRGPAEVKFDRKELEGIVNYIDTEDLLIELERVTPAMQAVGQDPVMFRAMIRGVAVKGAPRKTPSMFCLRFLSSPTRILEGPQGQVIGLEVEETFLEMGNDGEARARGTGMYRVLEVDTVIFAIGDQVDPQVGLPVFRGEFVKNPVPFFPIDGTSYEAFDPAANQPIEGVFLAGWARKPSNGLVGLARKDGVSAAHAVIQYLEGLDPCCVNVVENVAEMLSRLGKPVIRKQDLRLLEAVERQRAEDLMLETFKFASNSQMFEALGSTG